MSLSGLAQRVSEGSHKMSVSGGTQTQPEPAYYASEPPIKRFSLGLKPPPQRQRKSNYIPEIPQVIYSKAAAEFRPPADYQGPRKSVLGRRPEPSMNPKRISLPILSVSKLTVQNQEPLPPVTGSTPTGKPRFSQQNVLDILGCQDTKKILLKMPSTLQKHFRSEIFEIQKKKRPCHGRAKQFVHFNFHDPEPIPVADLSGIIVLGGGHRFTEEHEPKQPGTPPPLSGRKHCVAQTEVYVEDIMDQEVEFVDTEMQCEPVYDDATDNPPEPLPLLVEKEGTTTISTQFDDGGQSEIDEAYEQVSLNMVDAVIMESLKQLLEEHELEALRKQHELHKCLRHRELMMLEKCKVAQAKLEEQKKYLDSRKPWEEDLDSVIAQVGIDRVREAAPAYFAANNETDPTARNMVETDFLSSINEDVYAKLDRYKLSRSILDTIIEETVVKREMEYKAPELEFENPPPNNSPMVISDQEDEEEEEEGEGRDEGEFRFKDGDDGDDEYVRRSSFGELTSASGVEDQF